MTKIHKINALEILDSRGNPTVMVSVALNNGITASACVPSGASTGIREAVELRDGDAKRYGGKGVLKAVANVNQLIAPKLKGKSPHAQKEIDALMCELDSTENKSKLGANAILGVSMAVARAAALAAGHPLYRHLRSLAELPSEAGWVLPAPMVNILNGGRHAANNVDFQEFMVFPIGAPTFKEALRYAAETFQTLKEMLQTPTRTTAVGDEGGFAPDLEGNEEALAMLVRAIARAGFDPGRQIALALDAAASEFFEGGEYVLSKSDGTRILPAAMAAFYGDLINDYPIFSIEDALAENDWEAWKPLTRRLGDRVQLVGDDLFTTNASVLARGIQEGIANAILIKPNQIGTLSETFEAMAMARKAGYATIISHRAGETEDTFIADLSVATNSGQIKTGSVCRSERTAKYNRLLAIEHELGDQAQYGGALFRFTSKDKQSTPSN
jgi:enolase